MVVTAAGTFVEPNSTCRSGSNPLYTINLKNELKSKLKSHNNNQNQFIKFSILIGT